jgi:diguanylate cyclase
MNTDITINPTKTTAIKLAMLQELLASSGLTIINSSVLAIILAYVLRDLVSTTIIIAWLFVFISLNIVRFFAAYKHKQYPELTDAMIDKQLFQFRIGLIASGVLWGIASVLMYPPHALSHQMFFIFMLAGLSAGCVVSYSVDFVSAVTFVMLILLPMLVRLFLGEGEIAIAMTISVLLYFVFMVVSIRHVNRNLLETISARFDADEREQEIKQLAFYDVLTNLPNRRLMHDRLNHALTLSARTGRGGALLFLDLDNFKMLNDTLGHDMGDLLLKQVASRLEACVRTSDTVARIGGDEFTVILEDLSQDTAEAITQADVITKQIITKLNVPYQLDAHEYRSTVSIGIAMFGEDGGSHEELLKNADTAMYKAKNAGRNVSRFFNAETQETANMQLV